MEYIRYKKNKIVAFVTLRPRGYCSVAHTTTTNFYGYARGYRSLAAQQLYCRLSTVLILQEIRGL